MPINETVSAAEIEAKKLADRIEELENNEKGTLKVQTECVDVQAKIGKLFTAYPLYTTLVSFKDGSYKKVTYTEWKHSQWIHFTKNDRKQIHVNPDNVNYMEEQ